MCVCTSANFFFSCTTVAMKISMGECKKGKGEWKKAVTLHWKNMFFYIHFFFRNSKVFDDLQLQNALVCMIRFFFLSCSCSLVRYLVSVLFTAIITVFFTKWHHKHCTIQLVGFYSFRVYIYDKYIPMQKMCVCTQCKQHRNAYQNNSDKMHSKQNIGDNEIPRILR